MHSKQSLSGEYLKKLYTENKLNDHLQTHENLRKLLNYELDCMGDEIDSNYDFEIIDFCVEKLKEMEPVDEQKLDFLGQKILYEAKEIARQDRARRLRKIAAAAACLVILFGTFLFGDSEGLAGKFDFVRSLIVEDKGEQVIVKAPDKTLDSIEMEEGQLPDHMPNGYTFLESSEVENALLTSYLYDFKSSNGKILSISIKNYGENEEGFHNEIEINKDSLNVKPFHGIECYYSSNKNINAISWPYGTCIYYISGQFPFEQLEEILSLYIEEQKKE
ncbi:MAG: DUF4367 domain-containing protein [Lachnospiraceae bacterium]|nr:DUF4367 domain-containing protein [Lachnospiraceae bacterium]